MRKTFYAALREYRATALTKAFLFGVVIFPLLIFAGVSIASAAGLFASRLPALEGTVAVKDTTEGGVVIAALRDRFAKEAEEHRAAQERAAMKEAIERESPPGSVPPGSAEVAIGIASGLTGHGVPADISIEAIPGDADLQPYKDRVLSGDLVAVVSATEDSLTPGTGSFELFHGKSLDPEYIDRIRSAVTDSIIEQRIRNRGWDPEEVKLISSFPVAKTTTVTESGETESKEDFALFVPMIFMMLLWISVMTGGQYLLMSTIEEKASRVMEVLLSAVSPMQLLVGKIIGQGFVGLTVLGIYAALGVSAAGKFGVLQLVPTDKLVWLALYFVMAYFFFAALMAAVGSAVTEIAEAQSLMGPIMLLLMIPLILWMPIIRNPNNLFSTIVSFIPPATPFVMVLRMSQTAEPVPLWQVAATAVVGFGGVVVTVWAAAKIFRIGVLMYGKPPSLLGLMKWLRYA